VVLCVCVCVCEREKERQLKREGDGLREGWRQLKRERWVEIERREG
jgi:hypothetical protein